MYSVRAVALLDLGNRLAARERERPVDQRHRALAGAQDPLVGRARAALLGDQRRELAHATYDPRVLRVDLALDAVLSAQVAVVDVRA